ncbi:alpha/beta fold hydrolase [Chelatococcus sp. GCM10030263]|uniref:alpha/beta fold hydrolase n=1 Tax=Chelatococcus sp. GCM10030263 TaxID=3273387 RepID=UPI00361B5466
MSFVTATDGCPLHFDVAGDGLPLLLVPGLGGAASFWSAVVPHFAGRFRTIAVDHRGAGRNGRPEGSYSIGRIARDVIEVLDALGIETIDIVGHSTGGAIAQTLALDAPQRVRRLVLSGTWARADARFRALFEARIDTLLYAGAATYQKLTHVLGYTADWIELHSESLDAAVAAAERNLAPLSVTAARIRMLLEFDRAAELGRIAAPTLVIGAPDDMMVPYYHSQRLAAAIPGARLEPLEGGHFYPRVHPERFAALVSGFLDGRR